MEIVKAEENGIVVISISGRLDATNSKEAEKVILDAEKEGTKLLVDLKDLAYISSAGLRVLLLSAKKARSGHGRFCVTALRKNVSDVFEMSGFASIFDIADTKEEGILLLND